MTGPHHTPGCIGVQVFEVCEVGGIFQIAKDGDAVTELEGFKVNGGLCVQIEYQQRDHHQGDERRVSVGPAPHGLWSQKHAA